MVPLPEHVVFDLETNADRADPSEHEIIQIGAVLASGGGVLDEFETLVRPQRRLPERITELTGVVYGDLEHAPSLDAALGRFLEWAGGRPMIAHNGLGYDFIVLDAAAGSMRRAVPQGLRLDTLELAHVVYPRAGAGMVRNVDGSRPPPGRTLDQLAEWFGIEGRDKHDALNDARIARLVMLHLLDELNSVAEPRRLQRWILGRSGHPWASFLDPQEEPVPLDTVVPEPPPVRTEAPTRRLDVPKIVAMLEDGGALMADGRTPRPQQAEMAELVATALGTPGSRRMIEAPTGTGKTLAYLVPAIESARASGRVSVVAPHSRVLQDQILATLDELQSVLVPFTRVVLKGRHNYISLLALQDEVDSLVEEGLRSTLDGFGPARSHQHDRAMALGILCGWVAETPTGDWADLRTAAVDERLSVLQYLRWRLRVESPPGPAYSRLEELDFHRRASEDASKAHVAVVNHALLATGLDQMSGQFNLIIDEAHNLEDSVTATATLEVRLEEAERLCDAIWDDKTGRGFLSRIAAAQDTDTADGPIAAAVEAVRSARHGVEGLTEPLVEYVRSRVGLTRAQASRWGASYRIRRGESARGAYRPVVTAGRLLRDSLRRAAEALDDISVPEKPRTRQRRRALEDEKARLGREARNIATIVDAALWAEDEPQLIDHELQDAIDDGLAKWISIADVGFASDGGTAGGVGRAPIVGGRAHPGGSDPVRDPSDSPGRWCWALSRAPVTVAGLLADLWGRSGSVVLTSATLRAGGGFGYLIGRLGLDDAEPSALGSPFRDMAERHLVLLTDYLPSPRGQLIDRFLQAETAEIPRLFLAGDGGAMALMTARARLDAVRDFLGDQARAPLERNGIKILAQGDAGSQALVEEMRADEKACLLGVKSFREGVDIPGRSLQMLIVEKIPFDPMGDPLVRARMEMLERQGRDPFDEHLVPRAAIAFAQGTGRLIRGEDDRGVTVMLDNRMRRPLPYAEVLKASLVGPPTVRGVDTPEDAYQAVCDQLGLTLDEDRRQRIESIPPVATLSREALDVGGLDAPLDDAEIERRLDISKRWLGFDDWRPGQAEVMRRFMRGDDVLAVLPTGSGKSATYQIPALVSPGVTVVVSPLVALMRDQVDNLRARGVKEVAALHSGVGQAEQESVLRAAAQGHIKLLYVSPERLWAPTFRARLAHVDVARVAVDEAHCISLWGHSFRPEYAMIPKAVQAASGGRRLPVAAVTATATPRVLDDIAGLLGLQDAGAPLVGSVDRPEIRYYVERCDSFRRRDLRVAEVVEAFRGKSAIVYVPSRGDTVRLAALLAIFGHRVRPYSGAMELEQRQYVEDAFRHDEFDVVVATKAFGLGIDKPDIELIVHLEMPASIEEYVQETGRLARGARDGTGPATGTAVLLTTRRDCGIHKFFVDSSVPDTDAVSEAWSGLAVGMNFLDPDDLARSADREDGERDDAAALALHCLVQVGALNRHQDFVVRGRVTPMESASQAMPALVADSPETAGAAARILEVADQEGGEYRGRKWGLLLGMTPPEIEAVLFELHERAVCGFSAWKYGWVFERTTGGEPDWRRLDELMRQRRAHVEQRARRAREFARGRCRCRRHDMLRYLGESVPSSAACGACDACTPDLPRPWDRVRLSTDDAAEAVREDAESVVLILIDGVERGQWSRTNLVRALRGQSGGPHPLHGRLRSHGCYGRLSLLDEPEVQALIDKMIDEAQVEEVVPAGRDREYKTLRLTAEGRRRLRGMVP